MINKDVILWLFYGPIMGDKHVTCVLWCQTQCIFSSRDINNNTPPKLPSFALESLYESVAMCLGIIQDMSPFHTLT